MARTKVSKAEVLLSREVLRILENPRTLRLLFAYSLVYYISTSWSKRGLDAPITNYINDLRWISVKARPPAVVTVRLGPASGDASESP